MQNTSSNPERQGIWILRTTRMVLGECGELVTQLNFLLSIDGYGEVVDGHKWIYRRISDWLDDFPELSFQRIRRRIKRARELGVLVTQNRVGRGLRYRIDYQALDALFDAAGYPMPSEFQRVSDQYAVQGDLLLHARVTADAISFLHNRDQENVGENRQNVGENTLSFNRTSTESSRAREKSCSECNDIGVLSQKVDGIYQVVACGCGQKGDS